LKVIAAMPTSILTAPKFSAERLGQWLGVLLGACTSPSWFFIKLILSAYLPNSLFVRQGVSASAILDLLRQLDAMDSTLVLTQLIPLLLLCQIVSLAFIYGCGLLGKRAVGAIIRKRQSTPTL
jgi:hypothetical protein